MDELWSGSRRGGGGVEVMKVSGVRNRVGEQWSRVGLEWREESDVS